MEVFMVSYENYFTKKKEPYYSQTCGTFLSLEEAKTAVDLILANSDYKKIAKTKIKKSAFYITPVQIGDLVDWEHTSHYWFDGIFWQQHDS